MGNIALLAECVIEDWRGNVVANVQHLEGCRIALVGLQCTTVVSLRLEDSCYRYSCRRRVWKSNGLFNSLVL